MKKLFIYLIKFYQRAISPTRTTKCPYYPTCSCYGLEAVEKHGALKGGVLALWRILRCNPFSRGGYDPVPSNWSDAFSRYVKKKKGSEDDEWNRY